MRVRGPPVHRREDHYYGNMSRFREHVWFNLRDLPLFVWRDASVQHFDTLSGDYIWPTRTNSCVPFPRRRAGRRQPAALLVPRAAGGGCGSHVSFPGRVVTPLSSDMLSGACISLICTDSCMPTREYALDGANSAGLLVRLTAGTPCTSHHLLQISASPAIATAPACLHGTYSTLDLVLLSSPWSCAALPGAS